MTAERAPANVVGMKRTRISEVSRGIVHTYLTFDSPLLRGYELPCVEITGERPGLRLCVTAGVHVNEVSAIEAAVRLQGSFSPSALRGSVSIIPVVNQPALYEHTEYMCPIDGKNINFSFPGRPDGTFTEALCHALLYEWAVDADLFVDLHGGDLREEVSKFVMFQRTGDADLDAVREEMARCFDANFVVGLEPEHLGGPGRAITARARMGRHGVMPEAGQHGVVDSDSVAYHVQGVLRLAWLYDMIEGPLPSPARRPTVCDRYLWARCPVDGFLRTSVHSGEQVTRGQRIGVMHDVFGIVIGEIVAPDTGYVLWRMTHPVMRAGDSAFGIGCPVQGQ